MTRMNLSVVVLASAALLIAGCGGSSSSGGVAHLGTNTVSSSADAGSGGPSSREGAPSQQQMVAYSQCMRTHGVPEFPEPTEGHLLLHSESHNGHISGVNPQSAQFQAAQKACAKLAPNGGQAPSPAQQAKAQESALKFSQCMRSHGVPNFPDPEFHSGGGISIRIGGKGGPGAIDPNSPQFKAAQKACQSLGIGPKGGGPPTTSSSPEGSGSQNSEATTSP
jgi:hypothetical protein